MSRLSRGLSGAAFAVALALPAVAAQPCVAAAQNPWPAAGDGYVVEIVAGSSAACGEGSATVSVRGPDGDVFWTNAQVAKWNNFLNGATDSADLGKRLATMIDPAKAAYTTTADLPEWKADADAPLQGAMPFYPDQADRDWYAGVRTDKAPLLCYREAIDYLGCYALVPDGPNMMTMMKIGQQALPPS